MISIIFNSNCFAGISLLTLSFAEDYFIDLQKKKCVDTAVDADIHSLVILGGGHICDNTTVGKILLFYSIYVLAGLQKHFSVNRALLCISNLSVHQYQLLLLHTFLNAHVRNENRFYKPVGLALAYLLPRHTSLCCLFLLFLFMFPI